MSVVVHPTPLPPPLGGEGGAAVVALKLTLVDPPRPTPQARGMKSDDLKSVEAALSRAELFAAISDKGRHKLAAAGDGRHG